jgi:HEAT repeats
VKTLSYAVNAAVSFIVISLTSVSAQSPKPKMATHIPSEITTPDAVETRPAVQLNAADALGNLGWTAPYANQIAQLLKSDKPGVRSSAADALGNLGPAAAPYANQIAQLLKSDKPSVRSSAAYALGKLGPAAAPYAKVR